MSTEARIHRLHELQPGQSGDCFVLLASKDRGQTRDGKPFYRVGFRDRVRTATVMVWKDSAWFAECESRWQVGGFFKIRCQFQESTYGPQLDLDRIRAVQDADREQGFNPLEFAETSRFDSDVLFAELQQIVAGQVADPQIRQLLDAILIRYEQPLKQHAAAARNHHAVVGGFIEHVVSMTRTCLYLAEKYSELYPELTPPLSKSLVIAGAILHDIGKLQELETTAAGTGYTAAGRLIGHLFLGRDLLREEAARIPDFSPESLLRLEHVIVSHHNLPEFGSPIPPSTPEALIVHAADELDAKFDMLARALTSATGDDEFTSTDNPLRRRLFRGLGPRA